MFLYEQIIRAVIGTALDDSVLVVCAGKSDADVLRHIGFKNVVITNLDSRAQDFSPYQWAFEDTERLSYANNSFDWVLVNAGLHHCASPHQGLVEMYRVARKGVIALEARDSLLMRMAVATALVPQYELIAVAVEGYDTGGWRNGPVPNCIYRWTEREVFKTIETADPGRVNEIRYFYHLSSPDYRLSMLSPMKRVITWAAAQAARALHAIAPKQCNQFGFAVLKTGRYKPWMDESGMRMRQGFALDFDPKKYRGYF